MVACEQGTIVSGLTPTSEGLVYQLSPVLPAFKMPSVSSKFSKQSVFVFFWAIQPLVVFLSVRYTPFPNQLDFIYGFLLALLAFFVFKDSIKIIIIQLKWLALVLGYALIFIIVSIFGVDFEASVKEYFVLYLPLIVALNFPVAFAIGFKFHERVVFNYMILAWTITLAYLFFDYFLFPFPEDRLITISLDQAMIAPLATFLGSPMVALSAFVLLLISTKKTTTVIALIALGGAYWIKKRNKLGVNSASKKANINSVVIRLFRNVLIAAGVVVFLVYFSQNAQVTVDRLLHSSSESLEEDDPNRVLIALTSYRLLQENFPYGIGWGGFTSISKNELNYNTYAANGEIVSGANLHNSYMTWALEGGLPIVVIMIILFYYLFRAIRFFLRDERSKLLGYVTLIWLLQGMLFGMFHQWHSTLPFWMLFGFTFGCYERYKRLKQV